MARHFSMDDSRVGKGSGKFFKVTGTKDHPQRIAYIPAEAHQRELVVTDELKKRASRVVTDEIRQRAFKGDERCRRLMDDVESAQQQIEDIMSLKDVINERLQAKTKSAEIWTNENGTKVVLYPRTEMVVAFWVDEVGQVMYKEGIPLDMCGDRGPENLYGMIVLEYELDSEGEVKILPPDRQLDLGGGEKLDFRYYLKPWSINQFKVDTWKEQSRKSPLIFCDFEVYTEKTKKYPETKFVAAGSAHWRRNPGAMRRIVREARKQYTELSRNLAKDFSVEEAIKLLSGEKGSSNSSYDQDAATPAYVEEMDFAAMLGQSDPAAQQQQHALEQQGAMPGAELFTGNGHEHRSAAEELEALVSQNDYPETGAEPQDFSDLIP